MSAHNPKEPGNHLQQAACVAAVEHLLPALSDDRPEIRDSILRLVRSTGECQKALISRWEQASAQELSEDIRMWVADIRRGLPAASSSENVVLIVENGDAVFRMLEEHATEQHFTYIKSESVARARELLATEHIDAVVVDLALRDEDGRELLVGFRELSGCDNTPIIVLAARGTGARTECFALGASAYFERPFLPAALAAAVSSKLARAEQINFETRTDFLTGLPNRVAFVEEFDRAAAAAFRHGRSLSLAMIDLDRFKQINDTYGHEAGDVVLQHTARLLLRELRGEDIVARWGGEEFVMLFPETDVKGARRALDKIRLKLAESTVKTSEGASITVTFSAGVTAIEPGADLDKAADVADQHLYRAKRKGRNCVVGDEDVSDSLP